MHIVIVGMGEVGRYIGRVLVTEGHNVVLIDEDADALTHAEDLLDALVMRGHACNVKTLTEAQVPQTDLFVAVTDRCEVNLLSAIRAKELGAKRVVARVSNPAYFDDERGMVSGMMGIDLVINPQVLVALEMHKIVRSASAVAVEDFADNRIEMIQFPLHKSSGAADKMVKDVRMPSNTLIAAVIRDGDILVPSGATILHAGDELLVVGRIEQIPAVEKMFGRDRRHFTRRVIIVGGSQVGERLAAALARDNVEVVLMDRDRARCEELAERLLDVAILHADGTDAHLLEEENVAGTDAFIAASADDELNLMASLLAKDLGARRLLALIHKPDYSPICQRLGVDAPLSPRIEVAKQVLKYVRTGEIVGIAPVLEGKGEFLEFIVPREAPVVGVPIKQLGFPSDANICGIVDKTGAYVPRGDDKIEANDRVIVFTTPNNRELVEGFFKAQ